MRTRLRREGPPALRRVAVYPAGLAVLLLVGSWATAGASPARGWERSLARATYDLPAIFTAFLEVVMQAGTRGAVVVGAALAALAGRRRAAVAMAVAGFGAWTGTVVLNAVVERPRPAAGTLGRSLRDHADSFAFPSSHAAIAAAIAVTVVFALRPDRRLAVASLAVALLAAAARVHLGVHWPLDVSGGLALGTVCGVLAGSVANPLTSGPSGGSQPRG